MKRNLCSKMKNCIVLPVAIVMSILTGSMLSSMFCMLGYVPQSIGAAICTILLATGLAWDYVG